MGFALSFHEPLSDPVGFMVTMRDARTFRAHVRMADLTWREFFCKVALWRIRLGICSASPPGANRMEAEWVWWSMVVHRAWSFPKLIFSRIWTAADPANRELSPRAKSPTRC